MIVDIYTHIFPERFFQELERGSPKLGNMGKRLRSVRKLFDLDLRFKDMDAIGKDYRQIISLPNPPIEDIAEGEVANNLAKVANDSMAELVAKHPDRFPAFAAAVNLNDVDFSIAEMDRAIKMGAKGVQTFTNITGHPLDEPRFRPFFAAMAAHDLPVWIHPARTSAMPDYTSEPRSRFEMWWCFGWPYETTVMMCRLVFDGIYDRHPNLKIVTHHLGGGMIPFFDGRIGPGMEVLGQRTVDEDHTKVLSLAQAAAPRIFQGVLCRHRDVRRHLWPAVRYQLLRGRPGGVRDRRAARGDSGAYRRRSMASILTQLPIRRSCPAMPNGF